MHPAARNEIAGRVPELSVLDRLVADAAQGRGSLIWVQGEPGIGKTVLVNAALARAAARFCQALGADDAAELLAVAEDYRAYGWTSKCSFALEEAAVRLAAAGETARARAALTDAARGLAAMGASWDVRRADARLRPYGVRRGPRSAHRRVTTGWESLTPSEKRIAALVAEGLSNPAIATKLYLSRRTVETHVSHILAKLRVHSRAGIVRTTAEAASRADQEPTTSASTCR